MTTRARESLVVVTSLANDPPGLIGEFLRYGSNAPLAPRSAPAPNQLVAQLAEHLENTGVDLTVGYPTGRHKVDLVVWGADPERALAVLVGVHPDGPDAHIERSVELRRAGWRVREVYASRWSHRVGELAVELVLAVRS